MGHLLSTILVSSDFKAKFNRRCCDWINEKNVPDVELKNFDNYVNSLMALMTYYDTSTTSHSLEIEVIAGALGRQFDLDSFDLVGLMYGACLHDIGKTTLKQDIIAKPGKLTDEEYELVKTHTTIGHTILSNYPTPWDLEQYALHHHERLDGTGYPHKLKEEQITLPIRILHVADVTEALYANRVYRKGWEFNKVLDYLYKEEGKFDLEVVKQLEKCAHKIPSLNSAHATYF